MKKRLTIFFFYDGQGIVDRYVKYYLESLRSVSEHIVVVCNGKINSEGRAYFEEYADEFFCRKNVGLDTTAMKDALEFVGWDRLYEYDELIMANFTLFGPFYPLTEMFDTMDQREVDYWGVFKAFEDPSRTTLFGRDVLPYHHILDFTSSNFRVIRSSMLHSFEFRNFWVNLPEIIDYRDSVLYGEIYFNKVFMDAGFVFETYMSDDTRGVCASPNVNEPIRLVFEERMPFIRRKVWIEPYEWLLNFGYGEEPYQLVERLGKETDYDVSMIYENLIRTIDPNILFNRFQQNYIIPENCRLSDTDSGKRTAAIIYLSSETAVNDFSGYCSSFSEKTDVYIAVKNAELLAELESSAIVYKEAKCCGEIGGDIFGLVLPFKEIIVDDKYDYICYAHDMKLSPAPLKSEASHQLRNWDAMFGSADVVENIIHVFESNPFLGMMFPEPAYHGSTFMQAEDIWKKNKSVIGSAVQAFNIADSVEFCPYAYETVFWFRPAALKNICENEWLIENESEDVSTAIKFLMPYILKGNGFFFGCALTDEQAKSEITNANFMLNKFKSAIYPKIRKNATFRESYRFIPSLNTLKSSANNPAPSVLELEVQKARLYVDYGEGYSEKTALGGGLVTDTVYCCDFELAQKAKRIRFDPVNNTACLVRNAYAEANEKTYSMSALNGFTINNISYFMNLDPQMKVDFAAPIDEKLTVNAEIVPLYDDVFYKIFNNFREDNNKLKKLENKLLGRNVPESEQIKYDPEEFAFNAMKKQTGQQVLYVDLGQGFNEQTARKTSGNKISGNRLFEQEYIFKNEKPLKLRFDPANKCGCIVYGMEVISNLGRLKYRCRNGFELYDAFVFFTNDSQFDIIIPPDSKLTKLKIKAFIVPVSDSLVFQALNDCRTNLERYKRIQKILGSEG